MADRDLDPGEIFRANTALRMNNVARDGDGRLDRRALTLGKDALLRTIIDITWQQEAGPCVNPIVTLKMDSRRLYVDLFAMTETPDRAAIWRNQAFDAMRFRQNVEEGIVKAFAYWESKRFDTAIIVDSQGISVADANRAADVRPKRVG